MKSLSISVVFARTWEVLKGQWTSWALLIGLLVIAPSILFEVIRWQVGETDESVLATLRGLPGETLITGVLTLCLNIAAARGVFDFYAGRSSSATEWLSGISKLFWPCFGLSILVNLAVLLGLVLLVIPGVFAMVILSVALPARVAEGPTVDKAISRSQDLTKGSRWQILGVILLSMVAFVVLSVVNEFLIVALAPVVGAVLGYALIGSLIVTLMAVVPPVMYEELVALKGGRPDTTSEIFA